MKDKANKKDIPGKTIERLSQYRRILTDTISSGKSNIYSHELAKLMNLTPVQVRHDLMLIGNSGNQSRGYIINDLISNISKIIDSNITKNIVIIGMGNLGSAIFRYFSSYGGNIQIVATFDIDNQIIDKCNPGFKCYHINDLKRIISEKNVSIAVLTVPGSEAKSITKLLTETNIKGILNYTSVPLTVPENIFLEEYDMVTSMEKLVYYVKQND